MASEAAGDFAEEASWNFRGGRERFKTVLSVLFVQEIPPAEGKFPVCADAVGELDIGREITWHVTDAVHIPGLHIETQVV